MKRNPSQDEILEIRRPATHSLPVSRTFSGGDSEYTVAARRYRPQTFDQLVGQQHVTRPLINAIETNRVAHAFLFSGGSGIGKTSVARIFAKALQCVHGPTTTPCNRCDICQCISSGDDVDVIEINGALHRGIDDYLNLLSNVTTRPMRARFKIYVVDQIDLLTNPAQHSLLDILEEPPAHVKFIFCSSNPDRLPRNMLSRLQRFDFFPVEIAEIVERLLYIVKNEGVRAEPEALKILAGLADGSVRGSQSLLEPLLSLSEGDVITTQSVQQMLGMAQSSQLGLLLDRLMSRDVAGALTELDASVRVGVDAEVLIQQLLGYYRDMMVVLAGCPAELMRFSPADDYEQILGYAKELGLATILTAMQILGRTENQMRVMGRGCMLTETALVRICNLKDLEDSSSIEAKLRGNDSASV
ncbi:DNA polymerase III subunit gamma/tau [Pirellulaceae bacterium]|nr:DNA polymerase III subunit gamma/tau [Pirellulaceae bacterium]